jgi:hypothetical protein
MQNCLGIKAFRSSMRRSTRVQNKKKIQGRARRPAFMLWSVLSVFCVCFGLAHLIESFVSFGWMRPSIEVPVCRS